MNHQLFEDWLLNDQPLTPIEKRNLDAHLRTCRHCAALVEVGLELHSVRMVSPKPGFAGRFKKRLAAQPFVEARKIELDKQEVAS